MSYSDDFDKELIDFYQGGYIGFNEPDLTKVFTAFLGKKTVISTSITLTQSRKKWMASKDKNDPLAELGDFVLITTFTYKKAIYAKFAFIQAKSIKDSSTKDPKSFPGNLYQHYLMDGVSEYIFIQGKTKYTFLYHPRHKSVTNYLLFYRKRDATGKAEYDCFLTSVQGNCKLSGTKKKGSKKNYLEFCKGRDFNTLKSKEITIKLVKTKETVIAPDDCVYAQGFNRVFENVDNFRVGEYLDLETLKIIYKYSSKRGRIIIREIFSNVIREDLDDFEIIDQSANNKDGLEILVVDAHNADDNYLGEPLDFIQ